MEDAENAAATLFRRTREADLARHVVALR